MKDLNTDFAWDIIDKLCDEKEKGFLMGLSDSDYDGLAVIIEEGIVNFKKNLHATMKLRGVLKDENT